MDKLFEKLLDTKIECKLIVDISEGKDKSIIGIEGDMPSILSGLAFLVSKLKKEGKIPEELILDSVKLGLAETKDKEPEKSKAVKKEIIIDDMEKAMKIKKLLEELEEN